VSRSSSDKALALGYAACFSPPGLAIRWLGGPLGALHGALALTVLIPLLVDIHPRMASNRAGRDSIHRRAGTTRRLGLNYGAQTPLVTIAAHLAYDISSGLLLASH
jgi:hypothetical protein